ncbi:MAG: hypothetical protein KDA96_18145, partial [Planctomycetaceae bacterium]|nr:hypothetical protein [Planctomycetaceae bacterium]
EDGDGEADGKSGWEVVKVDGRPLRNLSYGTLLIETDMIITVDHKRPAAGQMKFSVDFTDDQYIDAISSAATEDTIRQASIATARAASLLQGITPAARTTAQDTLTLNGSNAGFAEITEASNKTRRERKEEFIGTTALHADTKTKALSSVLASQIFEINDPEFELKVSSFLQDAVHRTCR